MSRSSIFRFEVLEQRGLGLPGGALAAVVILCFLEAVLRTLAPRLPEAVLWGKGESSVKIAQVLAASSRKNDSYDVLILGPSHASTGISPSAMKEGLAGVPSIYNGGINGRDYPVLEMILREVYLPHLQPRTIVLTVSPVCFNRNFAILGSNTAEFCSAPMPRVWLAQGLEKSWQRLLVEHVYLYRYNHWQKDLSAGCFRGRRLVDEHGFHAAHGVFDEAQRFRLLSSNHRYHGIWKDYECGGAALEALIGMLVLAAENGIRTVVVNMPFRRELFDLPGPGEAAYDEYLQAMSRLSQSLDFLWLDYQAQMHFDAEDFVDVDHLNPTGAAKLSLRLGLDLKLEKGFSSRFQLEN
jgi:hypothetical protein